MTVRPVRVYGLRASLNSIKKYPSSSSSLPEIKSCGSDQLIIDGEKSLSHTFIGFIWFHLSLFKDFFFFSRVYFILVFDIVQIRFPTLLGFSIPTSAPERRIVVLMQFWMLDSVELIGLFWHVKKCYI